MKNVGKIIWIVAMIAIIVLIGVVGFGYYKKATFTSQNPVATMEVENFGTIKMELYDILKGEYHAPHISIWWYKLDSVEEVSDPDTWLKANPNLGKTVTYETYQKDVERAEKAPATRNDILAKRFVRS